MHGTTLKPLQMHQFYKATRPLPSFFCRQTDVTQAKLHVALDIQPGEKGGFLEEEYTIRAWTIYSLSISPNGPCTGLFQTRNNVEQCGFATAAGSQQADKLSSLYLQIHRSQGIDGAGTPGKRLAHVFDPQRNASGCGLTSGSYLLLPLSTAPDYLKKHR